MNHESKINIGFWESFWLIACVLCLSACSTNTYLLEKEAYVQGNTVELVDKNGKNVKNNKLKNGLLGLVKQQPNSNFFGINRRWFYYNKQKKGKLDKEKRSGKRTIYEEPSIFDPTLAEATTIAMTNYLKERGYFQPKTTYTTAIEQQQLTIKYRIDLGKLYTIDTVRYISPDTSIQNILNQISTETVLKKGEPVANQLYEEEKRRITNYLRNIGYREFYINYIDQLSTKSDTAVSTQLPLVLTVFPFSDNQVHQVYTINNISIYPYAAPNTELASLQDTLIDGIRFYMPAGKFPIKPEVISKRIFLKKGGLYSQEIFNKTVRSLGSLGIFKYANIQDQVSQDSSHQIDFHIYLPANKKIVLGADIEIRNTFLSESSIITNNFLGGALNFSYRNRNLLRGSEELRINFGIGGEFGSENGNRFFRSFDVSPQVELDIPKFSDPLRFVKFLNRVHLFSDDFYKSLLEKATTRISFGVKWSQRREFWGYFSSDFSIGYQLQNNPKRRYFINQFGLNLFKPTVYEEKGKAIFDNNPFLERSFNNSQLFTGILFKDFGMVFTGRNNRTKDSYRLNLSFELSGAEVFLANTLYNEFQQEETAKTTFQIFNLDFSQFARLDIDGSFYKYITSRHTLAFRLNLAWAKPYGFSTDIPYVKQFFAGGPTSIRAWKIRELGPGSYQDPSTFPGYTANSTPFYQTGDIKLLFSAEYRFSMFKLYSFDLEGALFLDGGNVWTEKEDPDRPGAEWTSNFYKQIALGSGVGFRMDFEYFKLALDLGYRVRNPYPNPVGSYWATDRWRELKLKGINYNLAVGYPF